MRTKRKKQKLWTTSQALSYCKSKGFDITLPTLTTWVCDNDLSIQPGGLGTKIFIYSEKLKKFLKEEK